ncbi:MAG: hypothetical protein AAGL96_15830 [Pseudomonadota bacterium]
MITTSHPPVVPTHCGSLTVVGSGRPIEVGDFLFLLERVGNQAGAFAGDLVNEADGFNLDHVGQSNADPGQNEGDVRKHAEAVAPAPPRHAIGAPSRV